MSADLRYALRSLWNARGFAVVAVATLALGLGSTTALYSVLQGVLLSPLAYPRPDRIVAINTRTARDNHVSSRVTGGDFVDLRSARAFEAVSYYNGGQVGVQVAGSADFATVCWTTSPFFAAFSMIPSVGHLFREDDATPSGVVSDSFARRNFGEPSRALGRTLAVENRVYEIVGVVPDDRRFPEHAEVWIPGGRTPENLDRTAYNYHAVGRLKDETPLQVAQAELDTIASRLAREFPDSNQGKTFPLRPLREQLVGSVRTTLAFLFAAAVLVLLVACGNTGSLLLARGVARSREIAVRLALGATRGHLVRQFLLEGLVLALCGAAAGVALAAGGLKALLGAAPPDLPRAEAITLNWTVIGFAAALTALTALLFSLAPLVQSLDVDPLGALKQGGRALGSGRATRVRSALVAGEIGVAFALTLTAAVLVRSLLALQAVPLGYSAESRLVMYAHAPAKTLGEYRAVSATFDAFLAEARTLPGVTGVSAVMGLPGGEYGSNGSYAIVGKQTFGPGQNLPEADFTVTSPRYFQSLGIPLVRGRDFDASDSYDGAFVAIVSESMARDGFRGEDPIGHEVVCGLDTPKPMRIVGIVRDVHQDSPAAAASRTLYMPLAQHPFFANEVAVVVHTSTTPDTLIETLRSRVRSFNPAVAVRFTTLEHMVGNSIAAPRFRALLLVVFGALGALMALAGVYGLMAYVAAQRVPEFGVRFALGARRTQIIQLVLAGAVRIGLVGILFGGAASLLAVRWIGSLVFQVKPWDPETALATGCALLACVLLASAMPAWRASRYDPMRALREE
jgi:predicted permease